ncbi:MAG: tetratricopeptide repeat protein [Nitrospira sp.]|nr:tetratricopeptide repeat protein [Nitrospira sp.]
MSEPETDDSKIQNLLQRIREKSSQGEYIYRGEPEQYDKISSTLYRKYKDEIQAKEFDIQTAQKEMLEQVKAYTDFTDETDMLTELQHYGGKTNLIDFTTDYLTALFFACDSSPDKDGRIVLLNKNSDEGMVTSPKKNQNNRVISQKSIFFQSPKGYLDEEDSTVEIISIPKEMKQPLLDYLRKCHGIAVHTIYNGIFGYIQNQEKHQPAYTEFYIGLTFQDQGKHEEAIKHYDEAIRINPQDADAYNNRGNAKFVLGLHREAIADCDRAININPQFAKAYYNRGNAKGKLEKYEEAIADFNEAIRLNPQDAAACYNRGIANKEIGDYKKARADLQRALELATEQGNQALAQIARSLLDELPPAGGEN